MSVNITRTGFLRKSSGAPESKRQGMLVLDWSDALAGMDKLDKALDIRITKGLVAAGTMFMYDTAKVSPSTPIHRPDYPVGSNKKAGELMSSGALFVNGVKKGNTSAYGEGASGKYQPNDYGGTPIPNGSKEACVVFNAPYAAKQHEDFPIKTDVGAGTQFMAKKLYAFGVQYVGIIAEAIKL